MRFRLHPVPILKDNYAWLVGRADAGGVAVVDPGVAGPVAAALDRLGLKAVAILVTHHHHDHVGGVAELATRMDCPVFGPAREIIPACTHRVDDGDLVELPEAGLALEVAWVPGHTRGHVAYLGPDWALTGDTLFAAGCGRIFEGTAEQMYASLRRLSALPPATSICCAHEYTLANLRFAAAVEPDSAAIKERRTACEALRARRLPTLPSVLADERATNPFLRCDEPTVVSAATRLRGRPVAPGLETFAALRQAKDSWR